MSNIDSFPPIANRDARLLILGSIPGVASLQAGQYYAHPRNQFWTILAELLNFAANSPYSERLEHLQQHGIAVWDVVKSCRRPGSLDAAIDKSTVVSNDFASFFAEYPGINRVYFNGASAEQTFRRLVLPKLPLPPPLQRLPSTSPAHAAMSYQQKLAYWRRIIQDY